MVKVVCDPEVMSGDPCIEGTRVLAETVVINVRAGYSPEQIHAAYPTLPEGSIEAAMAWDAERQPRRKCEDKGDDS